MWSDASLNEAPMNPDPNPNADSIAYWNEDAGPRWVRHADTIDIQLEPFLEPVARKAGVARDEHVLDVGCGAGALSLHLASRTGPGGKVTGVDVSEGLLELARRRATERAVEGTEFRRVDAQIEPFESDSFDRIVSRFGVMFFEDSSSAFRNLRSALRPGGMLAFVCWAGPQHNPWMGIPRDVVARHVEMPEAPDSTEPGPFRFGDPDYVRSLCEEADFARVAVDPLEGSLILGGRNTLADAVEFLMAVGPAARTQDEDDAVRAAVREDLLQALRPYSGERGVEMRYRAWLVSATRDH